MTEGPYDFEAELMEAERVALQRGIDRDSRPPQYGEDVPTRSELGEDA